MIASEAPPQTRHVAGRDKTCPSCGGRDFARLVPAARVRREVAYRQRFVLQRFNHEPTRSELKDLTDFARADVVDILACSVCGVFVRDEPVAASERTYAEDCYNESLIDGLFPRYAEAFRNKAEPYRALLDRGAKVLEIGSHYGAFLQVASEWGWKPVGVDIGKDTSAYTRSKGYLVFNKDVADCAFPDSFFDGIFVWNCFEQIPEPRPLLVEIHRIVKPGGLLVVRTPNAMFYRDCEHLLRNSGLFDTHDASREFMLKAMAYNNLLAFPYLYGYNSRNLDRLVSSERFRLQRILNSELLTLPLPDIPAWVVEEQREVSTRLTRMNHALGVGLPSGPWMELYYRAER